MKGILDDIGRIGVVPVITVTEVEKAQPLALALAAGGLPCAEVTFRTAEGEQAIRLITRKVPDMLVGAGTVLTTEQARRAIDAGARFIVSPGFNPKVVDYCISQGTPVVPGCCTPTEMEQAIERGLETVKFFPAEQAGGLAFLKAVAAPYTMLRFMPTGGIGPGNLKEYLSYNKILACGGSWMVKGGLIDEGLFDKIQALCAEAVKTAKQARGGQ